MVSTATNFDLPESTSIVSVRLFNAFNSLSPGSTPFFSPAPGSTADEAYVPLKCSGKSFLVEHSATGKKVIFDLGVRKDVDGMAPMYRDLIKSDVVKMDFGPDVSETLVDAGIDLNTIHAVIWSHSHIDHSGDPSTFPSTTKLVVGPGTQAHCRPGYPLNPDAGVLESDFLGREVIEFEYPKDNLSINGMKTYDYFGDGSFYLLDAPGHCPGHLVGLARTTPTTFLLMGGDVAHHPAMIRPSPAGPLPSSLEQELPPTLKNCARDAPFLAPPAKEGSVHHDHDAAVKTIQKIIEFDAHPDVLIVLSHDGSLDGKDGKGAGLMPWFPEEVNDWKNRGVKEAVRWLFLDKDSTTYRW